MEEAVSWGAEAGTSLQGQMTYSLAHTSPCHRNSVKKHIHRQNILTGKISIMENMSLYRLKQNKKTIFSFHPSPINPSPFPPYLIPPSCFLVRLYYYCAGQ
jgi:hypothetical protein